MPTRRPARADTGATRVPAAVTRPTRTGVQGSVAYMLLEAIEAFHLHEFDGRQWAISLLIGTTVVSWLQVLLENHFEWGFLRKVPPADEAIDVPGEGGNVDPRLTLLIAVAGLVIAVIAFFDFRVVTR